MNGNIECRICMNVLNEECNNVSDCCLSDLERLNSYCYLGDNMNDGGVS